MKIVREYRSERDFQKDIEEKEKENFLLHSWQLAPGLHYGFVIIAIFASFKFKGD